MNFYNSRSKFASPPVVTGLSIPEWQMKQDPMEELTQVIPVEKGPDLVLDSSNTLETMEMETPESDSPPRSEID